ncbi:hypothetical protein DFH11DRAFT_1730801 [Phellopilus nigrolimitatus]|nr:hypothetical protein DFH11DRAFT_1730801 [Phellopilus nigrolimitatus]
MYPNHPPTNAGRRPLRASSAPPRKPGKASTLGDRDFSSVRSSSSGKTVQAPRARALSRTESRSTVTMDNGSIDTTTSVGFGRPQHGGTVVRTPAGIPFNDLATLQLLSKYPSLANVHRNQNGEPLEWILDQVQGKSTPSSRTHSTGSRKTVAQESRDSRSSQSTYVSETSLQTENDDFEYALRYARGSSKAYSSSTGSVHSKYKPQKYYSNYCYNNPEDEYVPPMSEEGSSVASGRRDWSYGIPPAGNHGRAGLASTSTSRTPSEY